MVDTNCLNRMHHHHHYHERTQQVPAGKYQPRSSNSMSSGSRLANVTQFMCTMTTIDENVLSMKATGNKMQARHHHSIAKPAPTSSTRTTRRISLPKGAPFSRSRSSSSSSSSISISRSSSSRLAFIAITLTFTVSLILLILAREAHSLNCYTCSSADDPGCDEAFTGRANYSSPEATDCSKYIDRPAKVCRKIVQYIEDKKVVLRSCGYIDERVEDKKQQQQQQQLQSQPDGKKTSICHKRSGTFALMMESCVCYEDLCNHSASLVPDQSVLSLLAACSILYFFFYLAGSRRANA